MEHSELLKKSKGKMVTVRAEDLYELLSALNGPPHYIREQLVIMGVRRKENKEHFILNLENAFVQAIADGDNNG